VSYALFVRRLKLGALFRKGDEERRKARFHQIPLQPSTSIFRQGEMGVVDEGEQDDSFRDTRLAFP